MLRILATLAFAVSFDLLFFGGQNTDAAKQMGLTVLQHLGMIEHWFFPHLFAQIELIRNTCF